MPINEPMRMNMLDKRTGDQKDLLIFLTRSSMRVLKLKKARSKERKRHAMLAASTNGCKLNSCSSEQWDDD